MTARVITVDPETSTKMAALIMGQADVDVLVVAEQSVVVGTVSERNLGCVTGFGTRKRFGPFVCDVMSKDLVWLSEEDELQGAHLQMQAHNAQAALVKDSTGKIVGTLSDIRGYLIWGAGRMSLDCTSP